MFDMMLTTPKLLIFAECYRVIAQAVRAQHAVTLPSHDDIDDMPCHLPVHQLSCLEGASALRRLHPGTNIYCQIVPSLDPCSFLELPSVHPFCS